MTCLEKYTEPFTKRYNELLMNVFPYTGTTGAL